MLDLIVGGNTKTLRDACPNYAQEARGDMGFKHFAWILGGLGRRYQRAQVHAYGPTYGSGAAIVEFVPVARSASRPAKAPARRHARPSAKRNARGARRVNKQKSARS